MLNLSANYDLVFWMSSYIHINGIVMDLKYFSGYQLLTFYKNGLAD